MADGQSDHVPVLLSYSSFSRPSSVPSGSGYEVIINKFLSVYGNQMGVLRKCMIQLYSDEWGQYIDLTKGFTISEKCKLRLVPLQSDVTTLGNIQKSPATPGFFCFDMRAESSCSPGKKPITRHASGLPKMPMVCRKYEQRILEKAKLMCEMDTFHNRLGLHVTVQPKGITPRLEKCHNCCRLYHCPFCKPVVFKPTFMSKVLKHLDGHKRRAVQHKDHTILKCNLECRDKAHFHCPYCKNLFDRRNRFIDHLVLCGKRIHSTEALHEDEGVRESEVGEVTVVCQSKMKEVVEQAAGVNPSASEKAISEEKAISTDTDKTATKVVIAEAAHKNRVISKLDATVATAQVRRVKKLTVACPRCAVVLNKKNVKRHMERKHSDPCHA